MRLSILTATLEAIRSQTIPNALEAGKIQRAIDSELESLVHYADAIAHARESLRSLRATYARICDSIDCKTALHSLIRRLPNEILATIIAYAVEGSFYNDTFEHLQHPALCVCQY
ncbi:hypothetical protein HDZ31DRAFT_39537 [Schizophyllum fasciatum]